MWNTLLPPFALKGWLAGGTGRCAHLPTAFCSAPLAGRVANADITMMLYEGTNHRANVAAQAQTNEHRLPLQAKENYVCFVGLIYFMLSEYPKPLLFNSRASCITAAVLQQQVATMSPGRLPSTPVFSRTCFRHKQ